MSKAIEAACVAGVVTADGVPVIAARIQSSGVGSSSGILIMDEDKVFYIPSSAGDIKTAIEKIVSSLNTISTTLTSIGAQMLGPATAPPPTLPSNIAALSATIAELTILKESLK